MAVRQADTLDRVLESPRKILRLVGIAVIMIFAIYAVFHVVEHVDQNEVMVIQSLGGQLSWYQDGGYHWQGFGKSVKFPRRSQLWFKIDKDDKGQVVSDGSYKVRFNDGGHGYISGSISYELPTSATQLSKLYQKYPTPESITEDL